MYTKYNIVYYIAKIIFQQPFVHFFIQSGEAISAVNINPPQLHAFPDNQTLTAL